MTMLEGRSVLVVGASAGIGRAFAGAAHAHGAEVVLAARRAGALEAAVVELAGVTAVIADIADPADCRRLAREAVDALGRPIELVLVAAGVGPMRRLADLEVDEWRKVLDTNVVGVHQTIRALLPHLAPEAIVAVLSSEGAHQPRYAMGAYTASKLALEKLLDTWRVEHAPLRTSCVVIGSTQPTEFGHDFDLEVVAAALGEWGKRGLIQGAFMDTAEVGEFLATLYASALRFPGINIDTLVLRSPAPLALESPPTELTERL
jgi:NAD(P)-dependent dehydrogenase (short-subunit alcohol dehydrogenase family)